MTLFMTSNAQNARHQVSRNWLRWKGFWKVVVLIPPALSLQVFFSLWAKHDGHSLGFDVCQILFVMFWLAKAALMIDSPECFVSHQEIKTWAHGPWTWIMANWLFITASGVPNYGKQHSFHHAVLTLYMPQFRKSFIWMPSRWRRTLYPY